MCDPREAGTVMTNLPNLQSHLGISKEPCQTNVHVILDLEMLDSIDIIHIRNVCTAHKLLLVPLIDNRALRAAGQDEVGLASNLQKFSICVTIPRMQGLVGIEAVTVPAIQRG